MREKIKVAAAVLMDENQRILLSKRAKQSHQGGLWEFPGGKLEFGETNLQALQRELKEELGIQALSCRPLITVQHVYPERKVELVVFLVTEWAGTPEGLENQPFHWVAKNELSKYEMPAADAPVISAIQLPDAYAISPAKACNATRWLESLNKLLLSGVRLFQFRVFGLVKEKKLALARQALSLCRAFGARMLVNSDAELAIEIGADGVHLSSRQLQARQCQFRQLKAEPVERLMAASCHNLADIQIAEEMGVDFAVLSPVLPTQSHPDADILGWNGFAELVKQVSIPVYALGGMNTNIKETAWLSGAQGVSGIRGFWFE